MKKTLSIISTGLLVTTAATSTVACFGNNKPKSFSSSPIENYIAKTAWSNYVLNNPKGHSLDIPELFSAPGYEESNEKAFSQTNKKQFTVKYDPKSTKTEKEQINLLTAELTKQNKEAYTWLKDEHAKNSAAKFVVYFKQDSQKNILTTTIRELIQDQASPEVNQILNNISDKADMDAQEFPTMHGHLLWQKNRVVEKNAKSGKTKFFGFPNKSNLYLENKSGEFPNTIIEHKLRLNDLNNPGKIFSLDDWKKDSKIIAENDPIKKNDLINAWLKDKIDKYFLKSGAVLNSYPYIDYEHNVAKIMLISADKNSHLFRDNLGTGSIKSPWAMKNSKRISYKVVTLKNAIPTVGVNQQYATKYSDDLKYALQGSLLWVAKTNPLTIKTMFKTLKSQIPYVQGIIDKIIPIINAITLEKSQDNAASISPWKDVIKNLKTYKKLNDPQKIEKIGKLISSKGFNLDKIKQIKNNLIVTKQDASGTTIIDERNSPFSTMDFQYVISSNGLNQYKITDLLWLLYCASEEMVK